jgi:isocitrate dehydrogenase
MLKRTFEDIAPEYPDIEAQHIIIDNCAHQLVKRPEQFDVIVTTNMNGDIISDLSSALVGGLGFAPSANLGTDVAIFEAVHGSAPKYAGKNVINPTALILSGVMMLRHLGEFEAAAAVEKGLLVTLEQGKLTRDIRGDDGSALSTTAFTEAIIENLGSEPSGYAVREYKPILMPVVSSDPDFVKEDVRRVVGADVFVEWVGTAEELGHRAEQAADGSKVSLKMVSSRGTKVYPASGAMTDVVDQFRCRFVLVNEVGALVDADIIDVLQRVSAQGISWAHVEKLQEFHGEPAYTKAQGED